MHFIHMDHMGGNTLFVLYYSLHCGRNISKIRGARDAPGGRKTSLLHNKRFYKAGRAPSPVQLLWFFTLMTHKERGKERCVSFAFINNHHVSALCVLLSRWMLSVQQWHVELCEVTQVVLEVDFHS